MCGTELEYGATRYAVLRQRMVLPGSISAHSSQDPQGLRSAVCGTGPGAQDAMAYARPMQCPARTWYMVLCEVQY
eukprot:245917-Rhodomonas_salina.1